MPSTSKVADEDAMQNAEELSEKDVRRTYRNLDGIVAEFNGVATLVSGPGRLVPRLAQPQ